MPPIADPTPPQPSSIAVSVHARPTGGARAAPSRVRYVLAVLVVVAACVACLGPVSPSAQDYLSAAAQARSVQRYDRALADYARAAAQLPTYARPWCLQGEVYGLQQEWPAAVAAYRRCASLGPDDATTWLRLGDALQQASDRAGARVAWGRSAALGGRSAIRRLALADEQDGNLPDAIAAWVRLPPQDPQALAHLGLLALTRGDVETARADFVAARATPNAFADDLVDQGFVALAARPFAGARDFAELGYDLLAAGMPGLAVAPLRTAVARDPSFGDAHSFLGWALWQRGVPEQAEARQEIATGLRLAPGLSFAYFAAGEVAFADARPRDALALFRHGLSLDARNPVLWSEAARAALALADYTTAEIALGDAAALSTDPAFSSAYVQFYLDHDIGFSDSRALTAATTAAARFPEDEHIRFQLAQVYDLLISPSDAYYSTLQALALDPTDPGPYLLLGRFAEDRGDLVAAALYLRTALALRPNGPLAGQARELLAPIAAIPV